jgi:D-amino-acid oxidase
VAVIGAGVIGLTSAIELLDAGHDVTIFTRECPENTTSAVPAAIWFPYHAQPEADVNRWALSTRKRLRLLENDPAAGVRSVNFSRVWVDSPPPLPKWATADETRWLKRDDLPTGFNFGYCLSVPLMENPTYMTFLKDRFLERSREGFVECDLTSVAEIPDSFAVVVNCSGYGAKRLCYDPELRPGRGVIVLAEKIRSERHLVRDEYNETLMYVVSRNGDCVLGGCDETSETLATSLAEADAILKRCSAIDDCADVRIRTVEVGIRPVRDAGVCLKPVVLNGRIVIHNYGHGGAGFTLSWGCAEDVVRLVA